MSVPANYTLRDMIGAVFGCLFFLPVLLSPGYVAAWFTGVLNFRTLTAPWRVLVSLPLSVAICPILTYWAGLGGSWTPVFASYAVCLLIWLSLLAGLWGHEAFPQWLAGFRRLPRAGWVVPAVWFVITIASLVDLQFSGRLYLSIADYDHVTRTAITDAISRGGVRPSNPFYFLGSLSPLRYHYFWFLLCSLVAQVGGPWVSSRQAIIASVIWCGWSLIALVPLYLRFFQEMTGAALRRCSLVAVALFAVTGLDVVPNVLHALVLHWVYPEMEWWNEQVSSWFGAVLWVPHHVAALVACLAGFLLVWDAGLSSSLRRRIAGGALAGAAFATGAGTSIYVTLVFAIFLTVWTSITILRRWWKHTAVLLAAGAVSILLAMPYLRSLAGPGAGGSFVHFEVRQFDPLAVVLQRFPLTPVSTAIVRLVALPLNYFLELGFFGVVAVVFLLGLRKQRPLRPNVIAAVTMAVVSVTVCTFLRSGVIAGNDLGWRGFMPAQFIMLLWAADLMMQWGERADAQGNASHSWWLSRPAWAMLIIIGLSGTAYELALLRGFLIANDAGLVQLTNLAPDRHFGVRALELRRAYEALGHLLPPMAKLQSSPEGEYFDFYNGLYSHRQTAVADRACGAIFGGDTTLCPAAYADVSAVFDGASKDAGVNVGTWDNVESVCRNLSIDALVLTDLDGAWHNQQSWVWQTTPAITSGHVRVYLIGHSRQPEIGQQSSRAAASN